MCRYAIRFLVAVLTFGIGVALSLALGIFRVHETKFEYREWRPSGCPKKFRMARSGFLTVDSLPADPLKLIYLGTTSDLSGGNEARMQFSVENRSDKTISGYWINASKIWNTDDKSGSSDLDWTAFDVLKPGESRTTTLPRTAEGFSLRVVRVNFQDGSVWTNPRVSPQ
jgi:hypothetical protein